MPVNLGITQYFALFGTDTQNDAVRAQVATVIVNGAIGSVGTVWLGGTWTKNGAVYLNNGITQNVKQSLITAKDDCTLRADQITIVGGVLSNLVSVARSLQIHLRMYALYRLADPRRRRRPQRQMDL